MKFEATSKMAILSSLFLLLLMGFVTARPENREFETTNQPQEIAHTVEPIDSRCGQNLLNVDDGLKILTSPGYPDDYPAGIQCQWVVKSTDPYTPLLFKFAEFNMGNSILCNENHLEFLERRKNKFVTVGKFCGQLSPIYIQSHKEIVVSLKSKADNLSKPRRFMLGIEQIPCRHNYSLEHSKISHSGFGECFITITAPENHTISLYFNSFVAHAFDDSDVNFFKVYNGDFNSPVTHDIVGLDRPDPIFSTGNVLSIHTRNAEGYRDITYDAYYTTTDKGRGCGGKIINDNGIITTPMYPHNYGELKTCEWDITVTPGNQISLKFEVFDYGSNDCSANYLDLRINQTVVGRFCGGVGTPPPIIAQVNRVHLSYVSRVKNVGTGWEIKYSAVKPQ